MTGHLVAPRPVRILSSLQLPFFLSNALYASNAPNPVVHAQLAASPTVPLPEPEADVPQVPPQPPSASSAPSVPANQPRTDGSNLKSALNPIESGQHEKSIEELAASIRLDDEPQAQYATYPLQNPVQNQQNQQNQYARPPSTSFLFGLRSNATSPPASARSMPEDGPPATPKSPESAVLDEFLSILRPVIRVPSSPIARSKRLLPRSRHHHHHHGHGHGHGLGLTPSSDRHHPYARSAKSTSPSYDSHHHSGDGTSGSSGAKRSLLSCGRSSATSYGRRRSSNANESTHSQGSTSMSSSRSQSISRNGSDNSSDEANAWRPISPPTIVNDVNMQMDTFNDQDQEPELGPTSASGPGATATTSLVLPGPSSHPHMPSLDQQ